MKKLFLLLSTLALFSVSGLAQKQTAEKQNINLLLDNWHKAAAEGNFNNYFNVLSDESIFIGTDATEKSVSGFCQTVFRQRQSLGLQTAATEHFL